MTAAESVQQVCSSRVQESLACITAGSLNVLPGLLDSKRRIRQAFPQCRDRSDSNIVCDASPCMGRYRQFAIVCPFCWDTAWGLSTVTAANCCQAAVLHCLGLAPPDDASGGRIRSMKSWTCGYVEEQILSALAPILEVWDFKFVGPHPRALWTLTPQSKCVDLMCESPEGTSSVQKMPSPDLTHLSLKAHTVHVSRDQWLVYVTLQAAMSRVQARTN